MLKDWQAGDLDGAPAKQPPLRDIVGLRQGTARRTTSPCRRASTAARRPPLLEVRHASREALCRLVNISALASATASPSVW